MIVSECSVERVDFTCAACQHAWEAEYGVRHVEDGHGHQQDYFLRHGLPISDPTSAGAVVCPRCGCGRLRRRVVARHATGAKEPQRPTASSSPNAGAASGATNRR
jgi:hypothetical protein